MMSQSVRLYVEPIRFVNTTNIRSKLEVFLAGLCSVTKFGVYVALSLIERVRDHGCLISTKSSNKFLDADACCKILGSQNHAKKFCAGPLVAFLK